MRRLILCALLLTACVPETTRDPGCAHGARRCSVTALALRCAGGCTGWTTTSVAVPVVFTSAISAGLAVGTYNVEIVGTYVNGSVRWPENGSALSLVVRAPGAT